MMFCIYIAALIATAYAIPDPLVDLGNLPLENPDLFLGDIIGIESVDDRNAIPDTQKRWPQGVVPYAIDPALQPYTVFITDAIRDYHEKTCLKFVPRTNEENYVRFFYGVGCYSQVGMVGGGQYLSLGQGCLYRGTIIHELGHAVGFFHEQNRSDRDDYLNIYYDHILQGLEANFYKLKPSGNLLYDIPFDYDSVMLYGNVAFSKDGRSFTMTAKNGQKLYQPFDKSGLSRADVQRIKKMYNC